MILYTKCSTATHKKIVSARQSKLNGAPTTSIAVMTDKVMVIPVATIKPTTTGLIPVKKAFTPANFSKRFIMVAIKSIIMNEGKTTPKVAKIAPKIPP